MDEAQRRYLVTGAQGFLGRHVVQALLTSDSRAKVLGIGRSPYAPECFTHSIRWAGKLFRAPAPAYLRSITDPTRYDYQILDLRDGAATEKLICEFKPEVVIHLASGLRGDPIDGLMRNGVEGTVWLFDALGSLNKPDVRFLYGSSCGVYGQLPGNLLPIREDIPTNPADLYGLSKLAGEHVCRIQGERYGVAVTYARFFNLVGPGQDERHVCGRFALQIAEILLGLRPPRVETGDLHTTRDFIDVRDCARALILLSNKGSRDEAYNVASGVETTIASILDSILQQAGLQERVTICPSEKLLSGVRRNYASTARLSALGFRMERSTADSLGDLLNYYLRDVSVLS
jgi:GDP-4-dehydro-6-deoxy-D-mannose reductase